MTLISGSPRSRRSRRLPHPRVLRRRIVGAQVDSQTPFREDRLRDT
jgi:hypothetical protein